MKWLHKSILHVVFWVICFVSCTQDVGVGLGDRHEDVLFILSSDGTVAKNKATVSDDVVENLLLMAYYDGYLVTYRYYTSFSAMMMSLDSGKEYGFYVLANVGEVEPPLLESDLRNLMLEVPDTFMTLPMCWSGSYAVHGNDDVVTVDLTRLAAKICLCVDCQVPGMEVTGVFLRQAACCVRPFALGGSRALSGEVGSGDHAVGDNAAILNDGGIVSLYAFENMQGVLLDGNDDPMQKVPDSMSGASELCTYLEVACSFLPESDKEGEVVYKAYLGKDNVADFNIERNTVIYVSLTITLSGLDIQDSWKVETDYVQHATSVILDEDELSIVEGSCAYLNARIYPEDVCDRSLRWVSNDESVAVVGQDGKLSAVGEGECMIRAVSSDRSEIYDECMVTVSPVVPVRVEMDVEHLQIPLGESVTLKYRVHYNNGTFTPFISNGYASLQVGSPEGWTVSDDAVVGISTYGKLTPESVGTAEVSMTIGWWQNDTYNSCSASCVVKVTSAYVLGIMLKAPAMFYQGSEGPGLYGLMSDGTECILAADDWITSVPGIAYSGTTGVIVADESALVTGETVCVFTARYGNLTASVEMVYGKWVKAIRCVKTSDAGPGQYRYRIAVIYDDFTEEFVPFVYHAEADNASGVITGQAAEDGVVLDWTVDDVRFETLKPYYDHSGSLKVWRTQK